MNRSGKVLVTGGTTLILVAGVWMTGASDRLMEHLAKWESSGKTVLVVYPDTLARNLPTVCDGLTHHVTKTPIIVGERWTREKCQREQSAAVIDVQVTLAGCFRLPPPPAVWDMASSHAWNHGAGATCGSAAMKAWNRGDWKLGCRRIQLADDGRPVWSYTKTGRTLPNGAPEYRFVQGLANRKADERKVCEGLV